MLLPKSISSAPLGLPLLRWQCGAAAPQDASKASLVGLGGGEGAESLWTMPRKEACLLLCFLILRLDTARGLCPLCAGSDPSPSLSSGSGPEMLSLVMLCPRPRGVLHAAVPRKLPRCAAGVGVCCLLAQEHCTQPFARGWIWAFGLRIKFLPVTKAVVGLRC